MEIYETREAIIEKLKKIGDVELLDMFYNLTMDYAANIFGLCDRISALSMLEKQLEKPEGLHIDSVSNCPFCKGKNLEIIPVTPATHCKDCGKIF